MDKKEKSKFKKILEKIWKFISPILHYIWKGITYLGYAIWNTIKFLWLKKHNILIFLLFIILLVSPFFIIDILFQKGKLTSGDWGDIVGGCLGYYGTVILGIIAVSQTHKSLKQNEKTFISEKFSYIEILDSYLVSLFNLNKKVLKVMKENNVNEYIVYKGNLEEENYESISLFIPYKYVQSPINNIELLNVYINDDKFNICKDIKTDIVYHPDKEYYSIEIIFAENNIISNFENLFNTKNLLIKLNLKITSSFNVVTTQQICLNLYNEEGINIGREALFGFRKARKFDNISYGYNRRKF